uniref:Cysteine-rich receptor-like protein kinase 13 n=1 Tax=Aegilops tauschii TaxID=37682 RepID=N1R297_AEGTA
MATGEITEGSSSSPELPKIFSFQSLEGITNNFSRIFCKDPFGPVYKMLICSIYYEIKQGTLPDTDKEIAVKKLEQSAEIPPEDFENKVQSVYELKHENIVELIGFCNQTLQITTERLLCYDFDPNESLQQHLFGPKATDGSNSADPSTNWDTCFKIVKGVCQGLLYLHKLEDPITHMDLNLNNIWLDRAMVPKIANLGLSRIFSEDRIKYYKEESPRYMAPEYLNSTGMSVSIDIYSLGVMMIQITTREENNDNLDKASRIYIKDENAEKALGTLFEGHVSEILYRIDSCVY